MRDLIGEMERTGRALIQKGNINTEKEKSKDVFESHENSYYLLSTKEL